MKTQNLPIIGSTELVDIEGIENIPAKVDTGADSSSIWASHIRVTEEGILKFQLFDKGSPFYTGKDFERKDFKAAVVRNASGYEQIRYRTKLKIVVGGHKINALVFLSDRSNNNFPVLIGRRTVSGRFLVDVSKKHTPMPPKNPKTKLIQRRLKEDPHEFHLEYIEKLSGDVNKINFKKGA